MNHEYIWFWPMWFFPMFMPFFWLIVIAVVLYLIFGRRDSRRTWQMGPTPGADTALDILKQRYAKGEITKEEFEQMKRDIMS